MNVQQIARANSARDKVSPVGEVTHFLLIASLFCILVLVGVACGIATGIWALLR